jgi:hypothetical protein
MGIKNLFDKLLLSVKNVEELIKLVNVDEKRDELECKLKKIKKKCNKIIIPKVNIAQQPYTTSKQPMIPITGQSRLDVLSTRSVYSSSGVLEKRFPEDWEITWETGSIDTLIVEYKLTEDMNPDFESTVVYLEVYDVRKCLQPLFGTGNMDLDEHYQAFGEYLGSVDSTQHIDPLKKDFHGQLSIPGEGRHIHISNSEPFVTGESISTEGNVFWSKRYNTETDYAWCEANRVKVQENVLTVTVSRKCKDSYNRPTDMFTAWKKLELRSGGTIECLIASMQADGGYEMKVNDPTNPSVEKFKKLIEKLYIK